MELLKTRVSSLGNSVGFKVCTFQCLKISKVWNSFSPFETKPTCNHMSDFALQGVSSWWPPMFDHSQICFLFVSSKFYQQVIFSRSWNLVFPLKQKWHQQVSGLGGKHIPLRKGDSVILCDPLVLHETWGVRSSMISSIFEWTLDGRIILARPALGNKQLRSHFTTLGHLWMNIEP